MTPAPTNAGDAEARARECLAQEYERYDLPMQGKRIRQNDLTLTERRAVSAMLAFATPSTDAWSRGQAEERERMARLLCGQHGGDPDAVATEEHDCWEGPLWTVFLTDAGAILAAIRSGETPVGEGRGWRGIESAPKDGTRILIWMRTPWSRVEAVTWYEPWGNWQTDAEALDDAEVSGIGSLVPTHWQPLPDAPAAEVGHG